MSVASLKPNGYGLFNMAVMFENVSRIDVMVIRTSKCLLHFGITVLTMPFLICVKNYRSGFPFY